MSQALGTEIRRLRTKAGFTLRGFAKKIGISAAHQSDIEYGRRLPSEKVLREIAKALSNVGASYEKLKELDTRLEPALEQWMQQTPGLGEMLREVRASNKSPQEVLRRLKKILGEEKKPKDRTK
jgi:transcriptional regulator with XRE-family HTH domain